MDEKTEELRDIFTDVADSDTVTESQETSRGSLLDRDESGVREALLDVVGQMRERYGFDTGLDDDAVVELVHAYYDGASDTEIADRLDVSRSTVVRARLDVHLFRPADRDAPFDRDALRDRVLDDDPPSNADLADEFGVAPSTVRRYRRVIEAEARSRRVNQRYRQAFDDVLVDADLTGITDGVREDGLEDATDGLESNVSF